MDLAQKIKNSILSKDNTAIVYLYGSRARGDYKEGSDWDFLVITKKSKITYEYQNEIMEPVYNLELETGEIFSLAVYTFSDWNNRKSVSPFFINVAKEGILL